jgi:hypothetical protein
LPDSEEERLPGAAGWATGTGRVAPPARRVGVGLVAEPGLAREVAEEMAGDLRAHLEARYPQLDWDIRVVRAGGLVSAGSPDMTELIDAARRTLLREGWDIVVWLTDVRLRFGGRLVAGHASPTHSVVVLSLPAVLGLRRRVGAALLELMDRVIDQPTAAAGAERDRRRLRRLEDLVDLGDGRLTMVWPVRGGSARLVAGMVRANRPWRLAARLYNAIAAALAVVAIALVTDDVWRLAVALEWVRLSVIAALALISTTASLVVVHRLWERSDREERRDQVRLFNLVTVLTVSIGVVALYGALLAVTTTGAVLLLPSETFGEAVRSRVGPLDYVALIWLVTSLSTVGGALGAGLEASAEVREAAYPRLTAADPGEDADGNW